MNEAEFLTWRLQYRHEDFSFCDGSVKPLIMGVINVTPDSFSQDGRYLESAYAVESALRMIEAGADIIDIGGESSRPGAVPVSCEQELVRVIPVISRLRKETDVCISLDTTKLAVMQAGIIAGVNIINDITALRDPEALRFVASANVPVCLMHMHGVPQTMQDAPAYTDNIIKVINFFLKSRIAACLSAGMKRENIIIDPGFGFGKTKEHNLHIVNQLEQFQEHRLPIMLGVSRKSTLGLVLNKLVNERLLGGLAVAVFAVLHGLGIIRTHDVDETNQVLAMVRAIRT